MSSNIERCYQCGQCTSVCPMGEQEQAYRIRKILQMEKLGLANEQEMILPSIFYCTTCYRCQDNCPQGVRIVDGILEIRSRIVHNGGMLEPHRRIGQMLMEYGHAVPTNDSVKLKRIALGLDEMPVTVQGSDRYMKEIRTLLGLTGFDQLLAEGSNACESNDSGLMVQDTVSQPVIAEEQL